MPSRVYADQTLISLTAPSATDRDNATRMLGMECRKVPTEHIYRTDMAQGAGDRDLAIYEGPPFPVATCKAIPAPAAVFRRKARGIMGCRPAGMWCHMLWTTGSLTRCRAMSDLAATGRGHGDRSGLRPRPGDKNGCGAGSCLGHGLRHSLRYCRWSCLGDSGGSCERRDCCRRYDNCRWNRTIAHDCLRWVWHDSDCRQTLPGERGCGKCLDVWGRADASEGSWGKGLYRHRRAPRPRE